MAWKKGQSGNPGGRPAEKIFAEAVRMMVNETDDVRKKRKLRALAEELYAQAMSGQGWAFQMIADRLDGKPAQESTVTIDDKRDATDWTRADLVAFLDNARNGGRGTAEAAGRGDEPDSVH